jgi:hypothetical protein
VAFDARIVTWAFALSATSVVAWLALKNPIGLLLCALSTLVSTVVLYALLKDMDAVSLMMETAQRVGKPRKGATSSAQGAR